MPSGHQENPLSRWSRRKHQSVDESQHEDLVVELQQQNLSQSDIESRLSVDVEADLKEVQPILTDEDMPAIESLHKDSDFSGFMSSGVSDELRNLALRKLFKAPSFNIRDGLDEYDEDYTSFEKLGDIVTCDMKHQIEMEAKKKLEKEAEELIENDSDESTEHPTVIQTDPDNIQIDNEKAGSEAEESQPKDNSELTATSTISNYE